MAPKTICLCVCVCSKFDNVLQNVKFPFYVYFAKISKKYKKQLFCSTEWIIAQCACTWAVRCAEISIRISNAEKVIKSHFVHVNDTTSNARASARPISRCTPIYFLQEREMFEYSNVLRTQKINCLYQSYFRVLFSPNKMMLNT